MTDRTRIIAATSAAATAARAYTHVRWMVRLDIPEVMAIEAASFEHAWAESEMLAMLRRRTCIGMVAEGPGDSVAGFVVYDLRPRGIVLRRLAVRPDLRRRGVGRAMLARLAGKLDEGGRRAIALDVRETNTDACLFLRACGLRATGVERGGFDDTGEDAYRFEYRLPQGGC